MIEMGKRHQTRDGRAVEVLRNNVKNADFPIVGIITEFDGSETQDRWTAEGWYHRPITGVGDPNDLIPVPTKHEGWINVDDCEPNHIWEQRMKDTPESVHRERATHVAHVTWETK